MKERLNPTDSAGATVIRRPWAFDELKIDGVYHVECIGADGKLKWKDSIHNLVTTVGKNLLLDTILGSSDPGDPFMGLCGAGSKAAGDTQASHAGWLEVGGANAPAYTGNRKAPSFSAAAAGSKTTSAAVSFAITSAGTVAGCFINVGGSATKDDTTATLFSAGNFTGGDKVVANGDTLNVTYTLTA